MEVVEDTLSLNGMHYMYINTMERKQGQCQKIMPFSSTGFKGTFLRIIISWHDSGTPNLELSQSCSQILVSTCVLPKSLCLNMHVCKTLLFYRAELY